MHVVLLNNDSTKVIDFPKRKLAEMNDKRLAAVFFLFCKEWADGLTLRDEGKKVILVL